MDRTVLETNTDMQVICNAPQTTYTVLSFVRDISHLLEHL